MKNPLHILHLEDDPNDAALVQSTLESGGIICKITCVQNRHEFLAALESDCIDLILADFTLPAFDGLLNVAHAAWPGLPVILVSGTMGEELAIESLKSGATDYVLKERLLRLVPSVRRAMQEVEERAQCRNLEGQLIHAEKMEVVGQLAGDVAHDFNNILLTIMGHSDILMAGLAAQIPLRKHIEEIRHASEQAAGLTRQLLLFSRKQIVQPMIIDLNDVLKDLDKMLRRLIGDNIEMNIVPGIRTGRVKADSGYVGQLLMSLVVNARDAMPHGGKLTVGLYDVTLDENYAHAHPDVIPGDWVMLCVSDTGIGMTDEVKARLFETFFTTKPTGTGLGLATCRAIVQHSSGHIDVSTESGKGTTFKVYFPRVKQSWNLAARSVQKGPLPRGTETLLVVEDDPSVRNLARGVLQAQGYEVRTAPNGLEALHVVNTHTGSPIRLVVTDVIVPLMDGKTMADWLQSTDPGLKILFTSGYTGDALNEYGVFDAGTEFLAKPYSPATLARKVRGILDKSD